MSQSWSKRSSGMKVRTGRREGAPPIVEALDRRVMLAVTASFAEGTLRVASDDAPDAIVLSRNVAGTILVNGVALQGVTVANTNLIFLNGAGGDDHLTVDEANGALPLTRLDGGAGNDVLTGGSAGDVFVGAGGNDTMSGGAGADEFIWNVTDGSDVIDGRGGADTLTFSGSDDAERFVLSDAGAGLPFHRARLTRDLGNLTLDLSGVETINALTGGGADTVTINDLTATDVTAVDLDLSTATGLGDNASDAVILNATNGDDGVQIVSVGRSLAIGGLFPFVNITGQDGLDALVVNTLGGNDVVDAANVSTTNGLPLIRLTLNGGAGNDTLVGGEADDVIVGGAGNDEVFGQGGNDRMIWNPGDGSDVNEGGAGSDTVEVNGGNGAETFAVSSVGQRVRFDRFDSGPFAIDIGTAENLVLNANGGNDSFNASAGVTLRITADGGDGDDLLLGGGGNDVLIGGAGNDALIGGDGNDTLNGGDGDDTVSGGHGNDTALMGAGDDIFVWNVGDGSDVVDGEAGSDTVSFNGGNAADAIDVGANGPRLRLARDAGAVVLDVDGTEVVDVRTFGAADTVTVNDLSATDVTTLNIDLDSTAKTGFGDNAADAVIVNGTGGNDGLQIASFGARIAIGGLFPLVNITGEDGVDTLTVNTLGGNDTVDAANLAATNASQFIKLILIGGAGNDTLVGSQGVDTFVWNPGDGSDTVDGGENPDTLVFNGSDLAERFDLSTVAGGGRVRLTRDLGGVVMDLGGIEELTLNALGGADTVTLNDLTGTAVEQIRVNLAGAAGGTGGDGQGDSVVVNGRNSADLLAIIGRGGIVAVDGGFADGSGLPYFTVIQAVEAADSLRVNGNGGNDTIEVDVDNTPMKLSVDGGAQHDTIDVTATGPAVTATTVTLLPSTGDDDVKVNADATGIANVRFDATQRIGALTIGNGGLATLTAGGGRVLTVTSLNIAAQGRLDLADNALIVDYAPSANSPIGVVQSKLASGFHGGIWDGQGIMSSSAGGSFALGFAEASDVAAGGLFAGQVVDGTAVVVKFTLSGDANLDGRVDFNDLVRLAQHFNSVGAGWAQGDFNFDARVDFDDLVRLAQNFNTSLGGAAQRTVGLGVVAADTRLPKTERHVDVVARRPTKAAPLPFRRTPPRSTVAR
jgi:Ca2+-binding RTX toxin-like protein